MNEFIKALEENDLAKIRKIEKSDLHNHATRGGNIRYLEKWAETKIETPKARFRNLSEMQEWYVRNVKPLCVGVDGYIKRIEAAFEQADSDGISILSMSFGIDEIVFFDNNIETMISTIDKLHKSICPKVHFLPEIALDRSRNVKDVEFLLEELFERNFYKSIDIAGDEFGQPIKNFSGIYRKAKKKGLLLKAHVGEFGEAEAIVEAVESLELDQVQHGINAVNSDSVMKWLAENKIQLNICPTSNIMLSRTSDYKTHPIRKLFHFGIPVTINTDDMLIFNQGVSEEYLNLFRAGALSGEELDQIRRIGLANSDFGKL